MFFAMLRWPKHMGCFPGNNRDGHEPKLGLKSALVMFEFPWDDHTPLVYHVTISESSHSNS